MSELPKVLVAAAAAFIAAAQAPAPATPRVAAPTPTAPFSASRGDLKFDRACRDLTFETLASNRGCAARVRRGESAPTIEVVMGSLVRSYTPENVRIALDLLDRAITAEGHPAAQYLAGNLLTTAEAVPPDYGRGAVYLEKAVAGGNIAATDLLGLLVLEGRGTAQDIPRAVKLFERGAAGGMEGSTLHLAHLYLAGTYLPPNPELGRRIVEAAVKAGSGDAPAALAMIDGDARIHNIQLIPAEDPAKVTLREYRTFDNPEIQPSFGFTDELQRLHRSAYSDPAILARLERDYPRLPTPYIYELARRMAAGSPDKARGYLLLGRLRLLYDTRRCADPQALGAMFAWSGLIKRDIQHSLKGMTGEQFEAAKRFALEREAALPSNTRPWWVCYSGMVSISAAADGKPVPLSLVPQSEWPKLRQKARDDLMAQPAPAGS
ncbi:MAG: tetratricopeptide repeat protein [Allosphingosinicella sp.]